MLENIFAGVLSMSITASVAAVLILFFRRVFGNKLPKVFSYALWAIVLLRLLLPFSLPSMFSIFNALPFPQTTITQSPLSYGGDEIIPSRTDGGSIVQERTVGDVFNKGEDGSFSAAVPTASAAPMQVLLIAIPWIWLVGAAGLFTLSIFVYLRACYRLREAVLYKDKDLISQCSRKLKLKRKVQIYISDKIHTPVVCGLIKVRIILPLDFIQGCNELELKHIMTHELVHIKRFDYLLKPLSVLALCVHWFNPVIWLSFIVSQKDMEMSCDEKVMSVFEHDIRSEYATSLIKLAAKQNLLLDGGLLGFGERNIKSRIKGIMSFKKPGFWIEAVTIIILVAIGLLLLTNGRSKAVDELDVNENAVNFQKITSFAQEMIERDISTYESAPEVTIKDSKITRLELVKSFDGLTDTPIDVYALEYRLLPEDLGKVVLAGGMQVDEDGWLKETNSMGSPLLVISRTISSVEFIGALRSGGVLEKEEGLESSVKDLLKRKETMYFDTPDAAFEAYKKAVLANDSESIIALTPAGKEKINEGDKVTVTLLKKNVRGNKAYYEFGLRIVGQTGSGGYDYAYVKWLLLKKGENGWSVEDLVQGGEPGWWFEDRFQDKPVFYKKQAGTINITISPSELGTMHTYYYVPANQQQFVDMMDKMQWKQISKFPGNAYRIGISISQDSREGTLLSDGTFYYSEHSESEGYKGFQGENPKLYHAILKLLRDDLNFAPLNPAQISNLIAAKIVYTESGSDQTYTQRLTDKKALQLIEERFRSAKPMGEVSGCPFNEAIMTLEKKDGQTIIIRLASDSCSVYFANGTCFDYGYNTEIKQLFDQIPWRDFSKD